MWDLELPRLLVYAAPMALVWGIYWYRRAAAQRHSLRALAAANEADLTEPLSLHPVIDPVLCIGCRSCVTACPEGDVLGIIDGKARLVNPTHCIGHGACKQACPMKAIELVFGSARRGVDIPLVSPKFETSVPGIFIAGELGGMGLIQNAIEQGRQAFAAIAKLPGIGEGSLLDVAIVGAGPAGLAASLAALERKLRFVTLEQESIGGTVGHYPRGKIVMTRPVKLPMIGKTRFKETTKEALLGFWQDVERRTGLNVNYGERVESVTREADGFLLRTSRDSYRARAVLLAIGRRGTPRKLGVPGEDLPKVVYRLIDPAQYDGKRVLIVGGGDSALEAAVALGERPATKVTLSYRGPAFARARQANRERLRREGENGRVEVLLESEVVAIGTADVTIEHRGIVKTWPNDAVIVCAGGVLPSQFLREIGIEVETKYGTA